MRRVVDMYGDVESWRKRVGDEPGTGEPRYVSTDTLRDRLEDVAEDYHGLRESLADEDIPDVLRASCELIWQALNLVHEMSLPFDEAWDEMYARKINDINDEERATPIYQVYVDVLRQAGWKLDGSDIAPKPQTPVSWLTTNTWNRP